MIQGDRWKPSLNVAHYNLFLNKTPFLNLFKSGTLLFLAYSGGIADFMIKQFSLNSSLLKGSGKGKGIVFMTECDTMAWKDKALQRQRRKD
jgi:hypothetical protein